MPDTITAENLFQNLDPLAARINAYAIYKGFRDPSRPLPELLQELALIHSELSEALDFLRHGNPASDHIPEYLGIEEEMADTVIRILDTSYARGWKTQKVFDSPFIFVHLDGDAATIGRLHQLVARASDSSVMLVTTINAIYAWCNAKGWRLAEAILAKMAYNDTRPHMHGGKLF